MSKIKVIARTGLNVPREDNARKYIDDTTALEVEHTAYYRRRLREGDLVLAPEPEKPAQKPAAATASQAAVKPAGDNKNSTDKAAS